MFRFLRQNHLFASFASYSHQNIRTNLFTDIQFDAKQMHVEAYIRLTFSHAGEYSLQYIHFEANIPKTSSKFHIQVFAYMRIFPCKYSHYSEYLVCIASNYIGKPFTTLRPQLIFGSFWKYSLKTNIRFCFYSCKIHLHSLMRNKRIKHVRLLGKETKILFSMFWSI